MPAQHVPVFVGITGKRIFDSDPARNDQLSDVVGARLDACFDYLDQELPGVVKVLLNGGALGVDLLAARRVIGLDGTAARPGWLVAIILPFAQALFREDFSTSSEWAQLEEVLSHARVRSAVLPPLHSALARPPDLHASTDPLSRSNASEEWRELRRRHYEQVGLWIVDNANVLLGVMPEAEPVDKVGGTARIIASRRCGRPDEVAFDVISAGALLAPRPELIRPPQQYVWLLDPTNDRISARPPIAVLPPVLGPHATRRAYSEPGKGAVAALHDEHLNDSLTAARTIQRLGTGSAALVDPSAWPTGQCPAALIKSIRSAQSGVRNATQRLSQRAFFWLAALFVVAVGSFEIFAKFFSDHALVLSVYVVLIVVVITLYYVAQYKRWQPDAEDSRAIAELLRVQHAWWRAGLPLRVDHVHLQGADRDLARVRDGARNAITWAWLATGQQKAEVRWSEVWQPTSAGRKERPDWVGGQLDYFERSELDREAQANSFDLLSWMLFLSSFWLAAQLCLWLWSPSVRALLGSAAEWVARGGDCAIGFGIMGALIFAAGAWMLRTKVSSAGSWRTAILSGMLAFIIAASFALMCRLGGEFLLHNLHTGDQGHHDGDGYARYLWIVTIVLLSAIAGAMRFYSEKRAFEAEALSYREALHWFEHADELLSEQPPGTGADAADQRARKIIEQLGRLALAENESWLKSRRERPLTPVIGG